MAYTGVCSFEEAGTHPSLYRQAWQGRPFTSKPPRDSREGSWWGLHVGFLLESPGKRTCAWVCRWVVLASGSCIPPGANGVGMLTGSVGEPGVWECRAGQTWLHRCQTGSEVGHEPICSTGVGLKHESLDQREQCVVLCRASPLPSQRGPPWRYRTLVRHRVQRALLQW